MKNYFLLAFIIFSFGIEANAQKSNYRHQIQIGRSAKYFGDHPMKIGESGLNLGLSIEKSFWLDFPYLSYNYQFTPRFATQLSFENCSYSYRRKGEGVDLGKVSRRSFYELQWSQSVNFFSRNKIEIKGEIIGAYRFKTLEYGTLSTSGWESYGFYNNIEGFGLGGGIEFDYNFYKRYSVALKTNYTRFSDKKAEENNDNRYYGNFPKNQLNLTLTLGCNFGKVR